MNAIILEEPGKFKNIEVAVIESPKSGDVTLKIRQLGVCGTDLHAYL